MDTKIEIPMKRRTLMQLAAGAAFMMTGALAVPGTTLAEDSVLKGKNLAYIAFGLQYEYQVTLVDHVKNRRREGHEHFGL
jgi:ribose transport system substrate-binding protein